MPEEDDVIEPEDVEAAALALDTKADARNRGIRTALQFAVIGVLVDGIVIANNVLDSFDAGEHVDWSEPLRALLRVVLGGVLAIVMRYQAPPPAPED